MSQCVRENTARIQQHNTNQVNKPVNSKVQLVNKIINSGIAFMLATVIGLILSGYLINFLKMQAPISINYLQLFPDEALIVSLKVGVLFGLYLSAPYAIYQLVSFKCQERLNKKLLLTLISTGFFLFTVGTLFAYYALIPTTLFFLLGINSKLAAASFSISGYISFCLRTILVTGIIFELPLFLAIMAKTDIIKSEELAKNWKMVGIGAFIFSIVLTSSELFTQIFLAGSILFLYWFGIIITKLVERF